MKQLTILLSVGVLVAFFAFGQNATPTQSAFFASSTSDLTLTDKAEESPAAFKWEAKMHDFGEVIKGTPVTYKFSFVNVGEQPLTIERVKPSCGCTATDYTKTAIPAGETGFVTATYNAAKPGLFTKTLSVISNADEPTLVLKIKGTVVESK